MAPWEIRKALLYFEQEQMSLVKGEKRLPISTTLKIQRADGTEGKEKETFSIIIVCKFLLLRPSRLSRNTRKPRADCLRTPPIILLEETCVWSHIWFGFHSQCHHFSFCDWYPDIMFSGLVVVWSSNPNQMFYPGWFVLFGWELLTAGTGKSPEAQTCLLRRLYLESA